jgi:hypothetical protein
MLLIIVLFCHYAEKQARRVLLGKWTKRPAHAASTTPDVTVANGGGPGFFPSVFKI